ncbi:FAD-dependent oxidoreductase [Acidobacteria bacterium AH-259-O06]|nr:FAD-dependent oxidoreductase [Acidobacteria bacterium AH-259-O06]
MPGPKMLRFSSVAVIVRQHLSGFCSLILVFKLAVTFLAAQKHEYEVVVYGGTAGGVIAAVAAAREGTTVALLEPGKHLGGMVSGGLSRTDHGKQETIGGYSLEFFKRVGRHYGEDITWYFEPHVAEKVFQEMVRESNVIVFYRHRLKEKGGVKKKGTRITEIIMENGASFRAEIFADCTYEGDLMAAAGASYTWGREGVKDYNESLAGVRPKDPHHQFDFPVSAYAEKGKLLPEIQKEPRGKLGNGDRKVQAYNFRMILSNDSTNRLPFRKPPNYDPWRYELLARYLKTFLTQRRRAPRLNEMFLPFPIPNKKADFNNRGPFSTDYIGKNWEYADASYKRRAEIRQEHLNYIKGLFYFLANDPRVPKSLQDEINQWGPAKDEFVDKDHWPYQLYIREARRMVGDFVMTQKDIQIELSKEDVIGMGSYNSDSHNVQRYITEQGNAQNEGNMEVRVTPYHVPYRVMLPKKKDVSNLLVPLCVSASHVAYSTLRMEPVYMIMGHAAGVAAKMAIESGKVVQDIDTEALTAKLREQEAVMEWAKR